MKQISDPAGAVDGYLAEGGFPQYLKTGIAEYLQQIVNDILYRDIVKRHNVRNIAVLEELVRCLFSNVANEYSIRNLSRITNASSLHTITEFMGYLEDAYLFFSVPVFSYSFRQRSIKPRKVYSIDNGLTASNTVSFTRDLGKMLENAVFIGLKRKFRDIFYFKGRGECDFVIRENNATHSVIQVCYQLTSENLDRELRGLDEATGATRCSNALIVTRAESGEYRLPGGVVARAIPIVEWFDMLC